MLKLKFGVLSNAIFVDVGDFVETIETKALARCELEMSTSATSSEAISSLLSLNSSTLRLFDFKFPSSSLK